MRPSRCPAQPWRFAALALLLAVPLLAQPHTVQGDHGVSAADSHHGASAAVSHHSASASVSHHGAGAAAVNGGGGGGGGTAQPTQLIPYCKRTLGTMSHHQIAALRDVIQNMQYKLRLSRQHQITLERRHITPEKPGWTAAYNDSLSDPEHQLAMDSNKTASENLKRTAEETLKALQKDGTVAGTLTLKELTHCVMGRLNRHLFPSLPTVSFIMQFFGRPWVIQNYVARLLPCQHYPAELLVNVDEQDEHQVWAEIVKNTSGFVVPVFSNNIHEPRGYNRLAELARGRYLIVLQDDEMPVDKTCAWLAPVISIFDRWPTIGIIGHRGFVYGERGNYDNQTHMHFRDPISKTPMQFVYETDFAPLALRKSAFKYVGGLDETAGDAGECGHWADWELCLRMWAAGWQVAYHEIDRERDGHTSGTSRPEVAERCWGRQGFLTSTHFWDRWGHTTYAGELTKYVRYLNLHVLEATYLKCPYGGGCNITNYAPDTAYIPIP